MTRKDPAALTLVAALVSGSLLVALPSVARAGSQREGSNAPPAAAGLERRGADASVGFLDVACDPPAKILIDDADTGKVTPQPHLEVQAGHHKLTLVTLDGSHSRTFGFTVEAGKTRKFTVHLAS